MKYGDRTGSNCFRDQEEEGEAEAQIDGELSAAFRERWFHDITASSSRAPGSGPRALGSGPWALGSGPRALGPVSSRSDPGDAASCLDQKLWPPACICSPDLLENVQTHTLRHTHIKTHTH